MDFLKRLFIRNLTAESMLENFLLFAVVSILGIRLYLHLANYPQIGGGGLHIAHMLWGGAFMLVALFIFMNYLNKTAYSIGAIVGGIGFGTFIDELGKFITQDNNYFFQPTIAIIYVIFVLLFLFFRFIQREENITQQEYLINTLEAIKEAVQNKLDKNEEELARAYIKKTDQRDPVVKAILNVLDKIKAEPVRKPTIVERIWLGALGIYKGWVRKKWFQTVLITFFVLEAIVTIIQSIFLTEVLRDYFIYNAQRPSIADFSFGEFGDLIFSTLSGIFVILGIIILHSSRLRAYYMFKISVLISLLLTQFFLFYDIQFGALYGVFFDVVIFYTLNNMIDWEKTMHPSSQLLQL